jgi:urea transport system permease protein
MKTCQKILIFAAVFVAMLSRGFSAASAPPTGSVADDSVARPLLVEAILSSGPAQESHLGELAETGSKVVHDVLTAWTRGEIYLVKSPDAPRLPVLLDEQLDAAGRARAIRIDSGRFLLDAAGHEVRLKPDDLETADTDMRLRRAIQQTLDMLALAAPTAEARVSAVAKLGYSQKVRYVPILEHRLLKEADATVRRAIQESVAVLQLSDPDPAVQVAAANSLARLKDIGALDTLKRFAGDHTLKPQVAVAVGAAVRAIEAHITDVNFLGTIFHGISLGSILLVVALGLAITFGLMGVINMAHGEMIAVGAYTCYVVQNIFGSGFVSSITLPFTFNGRPISFGCHLPGLNAAPGSHLYESYFLFALPLSFFAAALAGLVLERLVIRFLYRRPLESLLATWGVSLVMQQGFRMIFGANNVQVDSPSWLLGHFTVNDVLFGYNRVFVIVFAVLIVLCTWLLLTKTPLGLFIRAVMQNRDMAACMGVRTKRVNMLTFAFGSGLAGLAGAFLSQIGNVGPSLGQNYIVDCFMTVVVGGVGNLAGTVYSAVGIGTADETLQQLLGSPVMGKIIVLTSIILFLQWKPGGLFAARGRGLDD